MDFFRRIYGLFLLVLGLALLGWSIYKLIYHVPDGYGHHIYSGFAASIVLISIGLKRMLGISRRR